MTDLRGYYPALVRRGIFKGVDLSELVERFWRLEAMRVDPGCSAPKIYWHAHKFGSCAWGTAYVSMRVIHLRVCPVTEVEEAVLVLLHEMVHCACPPRENHGELFRRRLIACAREAFGLNLDTAALLALKRDNHSRRAYAVDDAIMAAMMEAGVGARLREDPATRFEPPPPESPEEVERRRAEARGAVVAKREAHARKMLAAWERRAKTAKRIEAKWRRKVRGYEVRQAAAAKRRA